MSETLPQRDRHLRSSHLFLRQAVSLAIHADDGETDLWQLAIFNIVTALEHSLKAKLSEVHDIFTREDIDKGEKTATLLTSFNRLTSPEIGNIRFLPKDREAVEKATKARNAIAHSTLGDKFEAVRSKFCETFAFLSYFQARHLGHYVENIVNKDHLLRLKKITSQNKATQKRATEMTKVSMETYGTAEVFFCCECLEDFVTIENEKCVCHFCHETHPKETCEKCDYEAPPYILADENMITQEIENRYDFYNFEALEIPYYTLCEVCFKGQMSQAEEKIDELMQAQYYEEMMMDQYLDR